MQQYQRWLWLTLIVLGGLGTIFNLFQIVIIIAGNYNRNPNITSPILQTLDAIALTGFWFLVSLAIMFGAIMAWKRA